MSAVGSCRVLSGLSYCRTVVLSELSDNCRVTVGFLSDSVKLSSERYVRQVISQEEIKLEQKG